MNAPAFLGRAAREPLLHFLVLGAAVFGADRLLDARRPDPQTITVDTTVQQEARDMFAAGMRRQPGPGDMKKLLDRWTDNEILYREGLALGLDRGDTAIRERVIFKALSVVQAGIVLPKIDEAGLKAWFEARRARYDAPARYDFLEAVVLGDSTPGSIAAFVQALDADTASDTRSDLRSFRDRPRGNLVESYGEAFAEAMDRLPRGRWHALPSASGLRVVRLESSVPAVPAAFEEVKAAAFQDWKDDTMAELTTRAVRAMGARYAVRIEGAAP